MEKSDLKSNQEKYVELTRKLAEQGRAIETGFEELKMFGNMSPDMTMLQVEEHRMSFFAGAAHMYNVMMTVTDGKDAEVDAARARKLTEEVIKFRAEISERLKKLGHPNA